jgi:hypothetical protein
VGGASRMAAPPLRAAPPNSKIVRITRLIVFSSEGEAVSSTQRSRRWSRRNSTGRRTHVATASAPFHAGSKCQRRIASAAARSRSGCPAETSTTILAHAPVGQYLHSQMGGALSVRQFGGGRSGGSTGSGGFEISRAGGSTGGGASSRLGAVPSGGASSGARRVGTGDSCVLHDWPDMAQIRPTWTRTDTPNTILQGRIDSRASNADTPPALKDVRRRRALRTH